jgi:cell division transport system ATP-binding protein
MLRAEQISKSFEKDEPLLEQVSFAANPGRICVIAGETGSGKTTILRMLRGELTPDAGRVWMGGQDLRRLSAQGRMQLLRKVAMVHETDRLLDDKTVIENVALPLRIMGIHGAKLTERVEQVLARFGLSRLAYRFAGTLSAGQARQTAFARAVVAWPQALLADEPFAHLDRPFAHKLVRILLEHAAEDQMSIVIATHHLDYLPASDRIDHWQIVHTRLVHVEEAHENVGVLFTTSHS